MKHTPRNINHMHKLEQRGEGFNTALAVWLTAHVGSMWTAYLFAALALVGLAGILGLLSPIFALLIAWASQTFVQLVLLPVILVGQNILARKSELQADEAYLTTMKSYADIEEVLHRLSAQDEMILRILKKLETPQ